MKTDSDFEFEAKVRHFASKQKRFDIRLNLELDNLEMYFSRGDLRQANRRAKVLAELLRKHADDQKSALLPFLKRLLCLCNKCGSDNGPDALTRASTESDSGYGIDSRARLHKAVLALRSSNLRQLSALQNLLETESKPMRKSAGALMRSGLHVDAALKNILESFEKRQ